MLQKKSVSLKRLLNIKKCLISNLNLSTNSNLLTITLNRPKFLNALNISTIRQLTPIIQQLKPNQIVWIQGAGEKAFCAGGDIKALIQKNKTDQDRINISFEQYRMYYKMSQNPAITIAIWNGIVMGGGAGLSMFNNFRVATQNTVFAMPQAKIGYYTDAGAGYFLPRLKNNIGYYLGLTSQSLKGEDVYLAGLANYFISEKSIGKIKQKIENIASLKELSHNEYKTEVEKILNQYHKIPSKTQIPNEQQISYLFKADNFEDIYQRIKQNSQKSSFANYVWQALQKRCPLSVVTIFHHLKKCSKMSLQQCFEQEFLLCEHFSKNINFKQGVRCLLIDRNDKPKWFPQKIDQITQQTISQLFIKQGDRKLLD